MATEEELAGFEGPVAVFASEGDAFFPSGRPPRERRGSPSNSLYLAGTECPRAAGTSPRQRASGA
jgi:hypothetical protein